MSELDTVKMHQCVDRWKAGDRSAADDLFRAVGRRLEDLAKRMLAGFPALRGHADTMDIVQGASIRLLAALRNLRPDSTRDFYNLAAVQVRRELLDLARRVASRGGKRPTEDADSDLADVAPAADELDQWSRFHTAVENLPVEEREAVGLVFYHGRTRGEAAAILGVSERTVHRWWQSACERLTERLGGEVPTC